MSRLDIQGFEQNVRNLPALRVANRQVALYAWSFTAHSLPDRKRLDSVPRTRFCAFLDFHEFRLFFLDVTVGRGLPAA